MNMLLTIIVTFFAGMGAGLGTGFAGMSAAAVISPMLNPHSQRMNPCRGGGNRIILGRSCKWCQRIHTEKIKYRYRNEYHLHDGSVLLFTVFGSYVSSLVPSAAMGTSVFMTFLLGIKFIISSRGHDHKRGDAGSVGGEAGSAVCYMRCPHRIYLWFCRCGRRHDDASDPDLCAWI